MFHGMNKFDFYKKKLKFICFGGKLEINVPSIFNIFYFMR